MAIRHYQTILCDQIIEAKDGKISLIGLYDNVRLGAIPGGLLRMWVHVKVDANVGDECDIVVEDDKGMQVAHLGHVHITEDHVAQAAGAGEDEVTQMQHLVITATTGPVIFPRFGHYSVALKVGNQVVNRHVFAVIPIGGGNNGQPIS